MGSSDIIFITIGIVVLYFFFRRKPVIDSSKLQRDFAIKFHEFIVKRKKEIYTNVMDHSIWKLEMEVQLLLIEAKKLNLFPIEILKKLTPYSFLEMYIEIDNQTARKEIVELEIYFYEKLK